MFEDKFKKKIEKEILKKINFKKNFKDQKIDSLDIITIINLIEDDFKIQVKEKDIQKIKNFKDLYKIVKTK